MPLYEDCSFYVHLHHKLSFGRSAVSSHNTLYSLHTLPRGMVLWGHRVSDSDQHGLSDHACQHLHADSHEHRALLCCAQATRHSQAVQKLPEGDRSAGLGCISCPHPTDDCEDSA